MRNRRIADLALVALLLGYVMALVASLWRHPWILALAISWPPVLLAVRMRSGVRAIAMASTGMVLGPVTEALCISEPRTCAMTDRGRIAAHRAP